MTQLLEQKKDTELIKMVPGVFLITGQYISLNENREKNRLILEKRVKAYNRLPGPRVGDYLKVNGKYTRFTHKWDDHIQTGGHIGGGYYLGDGYLSYSGGLDPGIKLNQIRLTKERKDGHFWFFNCDFMYGNNGLTYIMPFRVYTCIQGSTDTAGLYDIFEEVKK